MGKSGTFLGIIALILGAGSLGLGGYMWISQSSLASQVSNLTDQTTWYRYNETSLATVPSFSYLTFDGLIIEFTVGNNEYVYFNFMTHAHIEPVMGWSQIFVYFKVNGITDTDYYAMVGLYNGDYATLMITLQHERHDLPSGVHNVTMVVYGTSSANYIYRSSLSVQKFHT
jgi:hypothetical protein